MIQEYKVKFYLQTQFYYLAFIYIQIYILYCKKNTSQQIKSCIQILQKKSQINLVQLTFQLKPNKIQKQHKKQKINSKLLRTNITQTYLMNHNNKINCLNNIIRKRISYILSYEITKFQNQIQVFYQFNIRSTEQIIIIGLFYLIIYIKKIPTKNILFIIYQKIKTKGLVKLIYKYANIQNRQKMSQTNQTNQQFNKLQNLLYQLTLLLIDYF
eukprot:TRINITY_DN11604_c0_g1_i4.p2 TRINITY_DN11604_c0_g1~~TRINITY_DN11604_c0_g1_i4.p2  ORF type:complete len:213 (-),score=-17.59 TRINITY_DN11604_c0_g1_i4:689-1327(-)